MPKVSGMARTSANPLLSQNFHELVGRRERADRRWQVAVRGIVARHQPADARQHVVEVPEVRATNHRGRSASRTRGSRAGRPVRARDASPRRPPRVFSTLRMPNAIVTASTDPVGDGNARRVAAHQRDADREPLAPQLLAPTRSMAPAKSTPTTRAAPGRASTRRSPGPPCRCTGRARARGRSAPATRSRASATADRCRRSGDD